MTRIVAKKEDIKTMYTTECPLGIAFTPDSKDFWEHCYGCKHCKVYEYSWVNTHYCDLKEEGIIVMNNNIWYKLINGTGLLPKNGDAVEFKVKGSIETKAGRFRDTSCYNKVFEIGDGWEFISSGCIEMWRRISSRELDTYNRQREELEL